MDVTTPRRVLVVEDAAELREALTHALETEGHQVVTATNDAHATRLLAEHPFDLLVADPMGGGVEALRVAQDTHPELPVITLGEPVAGVFLHPWTTTGNRRTLRKPFKLSDFIAATREALPEELDENAD
jgi:DNA-binding response OmpR family regulator